MPLWRSAPNTRILPAILLTLPPSKAADMAHLCAPQNQALGVCRGFVRDIQVCSTHGRENLVDATITSKAKKKEKEKKEKKNIREWKPHRDRGVHEESQMKKRKQ